MRNYIYGWTTAELKAWIRVWWKTLNKCWYQSKLNHLDHKLFSKAYSVSALWDAKQNLNQHLWSLVIFFLQIHGFWVCQCRFILLLWQPLQSSNKIYIQLPKTYDCLLWKTQSNSVDCLGRYKQFVLNFTYPNNSRPLWYQISTSSLHLLI
jgi:hypothetical protein